MTILQNLSLTLNQGFLNIPEVYLFHAVMSNYIRNFLNFIYLRWLSLTIIFLTIIFLASLYPVDSSTKISANDKVLHLVSYFILSFPASYRKPISYRLILTFFICIGGDMTCCLHPVYNIILIKWTCQ